MKWLASISLIQLFILCFDASFGGSMISLPRSVAAAAEEDMWLAVVVGSGPLLFAIWTVTKLSSYFPNDTCIEYHQKLLGPVLGQFLNFVLMVLLATVPVLSMRSFAVAANIYLLESTPPLFIPLCLLVLLVYASQYGLLPIIRMQQLIFASSLVVFALIILLGLLAVNSTHYQPILANGFKPLLKGAIPSWYAYTGPEFVIGLLYPFITRRDKTFKWGAAATGVLVIFYAGITAVVQGILGPKETAFMLTPTIIAFRNVEIPDTFIERLDGYFLIFWIPVFTASMLNWVYLLAFGIARMLRLEYGRPVAALLVPIILYVMDAIPNYQTLAAISQGVTFALMAWSLGVWPLLLGLAWWKEKRRDLCG